MVLMAASEILIIAASSRMRKLCGFIRHGSTMVNRMELQLQQRKSNGKLRALQLQDRGARLIDFSSNDYLGFSRNEELMTKIESNWALYKSQQPPGSPHLGSTGSRLLTGNSLAYVETEKYLADFHGHSDCLLANSGWDLNYGLLSCVPSDNTVVFYDELSHNSLVMGLRSGRGLDKMPFKHNDLEELRSLLCNSNKLREGMDVEKLIIVESIYSMDGDICPIKDLLDLAQEFNAMVIIDEAHSTGIIGDRGEGLTSSLNLQLHPNLLGKIEAEASHFL